MWGTLPNLELLASHTIPRPQQPQEEAQWPSSAGKIPNPKQMAKQEPQLEGQATQ
jgi:hypothetical protein